ncbi:MAG: hypothetical protein HYS13_17065 [Planctomycetia bacterium]|nr:hypothetical protein [Planctomycetia bacterium]
MTTQKWIALVCVKPVEGREFSPNRGAFVNVVGLADDEETFRAGVGEYCELMGFVVLSIDNVDPLAERLARYEVAEDIVAAANELPETAIGNVFDCFRFSVFHAFPLDDLPPNLKET